MDILLRLLLLSLYTNLSSAIQIPQYGKEFTVE